MFLNLCCSREREEKEPTPKQMDAIHQQVLSHTVLTLER